MFTLIAENKYGNTERLTGNPLFYVVGILGLTPAAAVINTDSLATGDGSLYNSSKVGNRNIVITLTYRSAVAVEAARHELYKIFKTKQWVRLYYKNATRDVYIDGYVETFEGDLFQQGQQAQISIICPDPFFKAKDSTVTDFTAADALLEFPVEFPEDGIPFSELAVYDEKSVINGGDVECGVIIRCNFSGPVTNPAFYNTTTGEGFVMHYTFQRGDLLTINTNQGSKSVMLLRDGETINMLKYLVQGSTWFQLTLGDNVFTFTAEDDGRESMDVLFTNTDRYEGV